MPLLPRLFAWCLLAKKRPGQQARQHLAHVLSKSMALQSSAGSSVLCSTKAACYVAPITTSWLWLLVNQQTTYQESELKQQVCLPVLRTLQLSKALVSHFMSNHQRGSTLASNRASNQTVPGAHSNLHYPASTPYPPSHLGKVPLLHVWLGRSCHATFAGSAHA